MGIIGKLRYSNLFIVYSCFIVLNRKTKFVLKQSEQYPKVLEEVLLQKSFRTADLPFVTNRQIHHWIEIGVINDHRKQASSGFKSDFNFLEALWIKVVTKMRSFRIGNNSIKEVKQYFFETITLQPDDTNQLSFQKVIQQIIEHQKSVFLVMFENSAVRLLEKKEYLELLKEKRAIHHFSLGLDILVWELLTLFDFDPEINLINQYYKNTD